jgi:predicted Rossmann-fold nucleotide-binding protein
MEAVAQGARAGGGRSIGILPFAETSGERANEFIDHAVFTGLGDGRNFLTAALPDAAIALAGEAGTLSEIGLALKVGTPLVYLGAWRFLNDHGLPVAPYTESAEEAVRLVFAALELEPGQTLSAPLRRPTISDQAAHLLGLEQAVQSWSKS